MKMLTKNGIYCSYLNWIYSTTEKYHKNLNLHTCLKEHKRDIKAANLNNILVHISQPNHNFDYNSAKILIYIHNKRLRRTFEVGAISFCDSLNTRSDFYNIVELTQPLRGRNCVLFYQYVTSECMDYYR